MQRFVYAVVVAFSLACPWQPAFARGDKGHEIIALVAERFLDRAVHAKIASMLAADPDNLTAHDIADEATWADRYRDFDRNGSSDRN